MGRADQARHSKFGITIAAVAALACGAAGGTERAQDNVITTAEDAFGLVVGNQAVGLYSMADARGFSPQQAGNLRIEGLYFDNPSSYVGACTAHATVMRIGITAQRYSFPAPTGIADLRLHVAGDEPALGAVLTRGPYAESTARIEGQTPLGEHVGATLCAEYSRNFMPEQAREAENLSLGASLRLHPSADTEVVPFVSGLGGSQYRMVPFVYSDGLTAPPLFDVGELAAQPTTSAGWRNATFGVVAHQRFGSEWSLDLGLFHAVEQDRRSDVDEYLSVQPDRSVPAHVLDDVPPLSATSTSGEFRFVRRFDGDVHARKLDLSLRGRRSDHAYGGDTLLCYGATTLDSPAPASPGTACGGLEPSVDETRQIDLGVVYEERWNGVGAVGLGVLKSDYRRTLRTAGAAGEPTVATPWLANLRFTAEAGRTVTLYGSFLQALEDSALAPYSAANRGQPPPATRSHQVDAGLRYAPSERLSLVAGVFDIEKVYFNLDANDVYTALGTVRHRGLEASLAYALDGLTALAGTVWLRPHVERTVPEPGATGSVPIGPVPLSVLASLDYAPARWHGFGGALQANYQSRRVATVDNAAWLPSLTTLNAGLRYEGRLAGHPFSVRLDAANLTGARGLHVSTVGLVVPEFGRRYMLSFEVNR